MRCTFASDAFFLPFPSLSLPTPLQRATYSFSGGVTLALHGKILDRGYSHIGQRHRDQVWDAGGGLHKKRIPRGLLTANLKRIEEFYWLWLWGGGSRTGDVKS